MDAASFNVSLSGVVPLVFGGWLSNDPFVCDLSGTLASPFLRFTLTLLASRFASTSSRETPAAIHFVRAK